MTQRSNKVFPKEAPTKESVSKALSTDWFRALQDRKGSACDKMSVDSKTIDNGITRKNLPALHNALASLLVDETALNAVFALYGFKVSRLVSEASNDMGTIADLSRLTAEFASALKDGVRSPSETCNIADLIRPTMSNLTAIVEEADRIKGAA